MKWLLERSFIVGLALLSGTATFACGDKLLAVSRNARFPRFYVARQANLVIYSAGAGSSTTLSSTKLQATLRRSVHKLQVVQDGTELHGTLRSGAVDILLVDSNELAGVTRELQSVPSKPIIVPVLAKPSSSDFAAVEKEYKFVLKGTADDLEYLTAIDAAMRSRLKTAARY
jgi:hypothetical protein